MTKIKDYHESKARRAGATYTWVWEVVIEEWNDHSCEFCTATDAYFFDPWKAVQYGLDKYLGGCMVQVALLHTDYLTDENGVK